MAIAEVRTRHVQALIDRLDAGGLSQRRVDAVVHALRSLFAYARERDLVESSPAEAVALPDEEPVPAAVPAVATATAGAEAAGAPVASPTVAMIPEQVIWSCLKAVTLMFVLIALVLVAESV